MRRATVTTRPSWREKQPETPALDNKSIEELTDEELEAIIRRARAEGALPTSHMTIQRVIIDGRSPAKPTIDDCADETG